MWALSLRASLLTVGLVLAFGLEGCAETPSSPEAVRPLPVGSSVPSAQVHTLAAESVDLAALVAERGALLVFYRGGW